MRHFGLLTDIKKHFSTSRDIAGHSTVFKGHLGKFMMSRDIWWHQGTSRDIWGHPGTCFLTCYSYQWQIWRRAREKEFQWLHSQTPAPLKCRYVDMSRRCPTSFPSSPCPRIERRRRRRTRIRQSSCIILLKSKESRWDISDCIREYFQACSLWTENLFSRISSPVILQHP